MIGRYLVFFCLVFSCAGASSDRAAYYWKSTPVGDTAQLLTLFCHPCEPLTQNGGEIPLVAVMRDTLGDQTPENDRITDLWLLTYSPPNLGRRILSAVPFFYWRVGGGSRKVNANDIQPLLNVSAPTHPALSSVGRDIVQWIAIDPVSMGVRATSREYRSNELDHERLHIAEAETYLRSAPVADDGSALTQKQLDTVLARLELRKALLGGFVNQSRAAKFGAESGFEIERVRARNWELLRQCADKTGLIFEPLNLAGTKDQYAMLWAPAEESSSPVGTSLGPVWRLLDIKDPFHNQDRTLSADSYERAFDANGALLPVGTRGERTAKLIPLGLYSLNYPRVPLLLIDFRSNAHLRRHELTQRAINEITSGVIGISHFTNWYYFAGADVYDFYVSRHGSAMNQAERLDCYSQFRAALALDGDVDARLRTDMRNRVDSLAVNPLEIAPARELQAALKRYRSLEAAAGPDGKLMARVNKERSAEVAVFGESTGARVRQGIFHYVTFGKYTPQAKGGAIEAQVDICRRVAFNLSLLSGLASAGTLPEVGYDRSRIEAAVAELSDLLPSVKAQAIRAQASQTLGRLNTLSQDAGLKAEFTLALSSLQGSVPAPVRSTAAETPGSSGGGSDAAGSLELFR